MLREPAFSLDILKARGDLIDFFQRNRAERVAIQISLAKLGKKRLIRVTDYFYGAVSSQVLKLRAYRLLSIIALLSPFVLFFNIGLGALLIFLSIATNMFVYYKRRFDIAADLDALSYIVRLVQCVRQLIRADLTAPDLMELKKRLHSQYGRINNIGKRGFYLFFNSPGSLMDIVFEYVKIVLLKELIDYEYLCNAVSKHKNELIEVYDAIGLLDCSISMASFRESVSFYCEPESGKHRPESAKYLEFDGIYHPMLSDPIVNSLSIERPVLVTGSNASGKSIFLKTVAINAIKLLRLMGYGSAIVEEAEKRADGFINHGSWTEISG
jgi:hypothetical protein